MMARLSPGARRVVALFLLVTAIAAAAGLVALPLILFQSQQAELTGIERRIVELSRRLPQRESLLAQERLLRDGAEQDRLLVRGSTPSVAAAQLQGDLTALASAMGAVVTSVQSLETVATQRFREIGLRLTLSGDIAAVRDFLYAVETRTPILLLRSFALSRGGEGDAGSEESERLTATMDVHGFMADTPNG